MRSLFSAPTPKVVHPDDWENVPLWAVLRRKSETNHPDEVLLSLYRDYGVVPKDSRDDNANQASEDLSSHRFVEKGNLVVNKMKTWQGSLAVSRYQGIVSPAYYVCTVDYSFLDLRFFEYALRSQPYIDLYRALSKGVRPGQWDLPYDDFARVRLWYPNIETQRQIADFLDERAQVLEELTPVLGKQGRLYELLVERRQALITAAVTGQLGPDVLNKLS